METVWHVVLTTLLLGPVETKAPQSNPEVAQVRKIVSDINTYDGCKELAGILLSISDQISNGRGQTAAKCVLLPLDQSEKSAQMADLS